MEKNKKPCHATLSITGIPDWKSRSVREFDVDEIVVATFADAAEDRLRSYELLAGIFDLNQRSEVPSIQASPNGSGKNNGY